MDPRRGQQRQQFKLFEIPCRSGAFDVLLYFFLAARDVIQTRGRTFCGLILAESPDQAGSVSNLVARALDPVHVVFGDKCYINKVV